MSNIFSKFFMSFNFNKKKYLPAPEENKINGVSASMAMNKLNDTATYPVKSYKTLASFDLNIAEPNYKGAIPDATIKFYPLD